MEQLTLPWAAGSEPKRITATITLQGPNQVTLEAALNEIEGVLADEVDWDAYSPIDCWIDSHANNLQVAR